MANGTFPRIRSGEFFQKELSKQLHREIPYTSEPKRYDSQPIVEYCTYYNNHIDNFELKSGEPKK